MKHFIFFIIKSVIIGVIAIQTTSADTTGYTLINNSISDPVYLSLCGLALLYLGLYKKPSEKETAAK